MFAKCFCDHCGTASRESHIEEKGRIAMSMLFGLDAVKALGKAIDEQGQAPTYRLVRWICHHCRRPYKYSLSIGRWACNCDGPTVYGRKETLP